MVGMILMENLNKIFRKNLDKYFEEVDKDDTRLY